MTNEQARQKAIEAYKALSNKTITIETDADFTPKGKRTAKIVRHAISGKKVPARIRCYVSGRAYMDLPLTDYKMANEWIVG